VQGLIVNSSATGACCKTGELVVSSLLHAAAFFKFSKPINKPLVYGTLLFLVQMAPQRVPDMQAGFEDLLEAVHLDLYGLSSQSVL
jgi:hypothetical protein